jgi:hypothetical protein
MKIPLPRAPLWFGRYQDWGATPCGLRVWKYDVRHRDWVMASVLASGSAGCAWWLDVGWWGLLFYLLSGLAGVAMVELFYQMSDEA